MHNKINEILGMHSFTTVMASELA